MSTRPTFYSTRPKAFRPYLLQAMSYFEMYEQNLIFQGQYWLGQHWLMLFLAAEAGEI